MHSMTWDEFKNAVEKELRERIGEAYGQTPIWFMDFSFPGEMGEIMISVDDKLGLAIS